MLTMLYAQVNCRDVYRNKGYTQSNCEQDDPCGGGKLSLIIRKAIEVALRKQYNKEHTFNILLRNSPRRRVIVIKIHYRLIELDGIKMP